MASQSTSISDLPRTESNSNDDIQESMMVNSILLDIENDEDLNDVNEDTLQYSIDTSQIPPKIGPEMPTKEEIQETTKNIFNDDFPIPQDLMPEPKVEETNNEIDEFLNNKFESEETKEPEVTKSILDRIQDLLPLMVIIMIVFFILSLPQLNHFILGRLPKLTSGSSNEPSMLFLLIKALILGCIYLASALFM
jgi:hypothetical protein